METESPRVTVLDCTLRDGGFYTAWDYETSLVNAYVAAMDAAKVDVIELGYRAFAYPGFVGALGYSQDWYLARLPATQHARIALMIDAKELATEGRKIEQLFAPRARSRVAVVRVATVLAHLGLAIDAVRRLHDLGYETTINLMAAGTLTDEQRARAFREIDKSPTDVLYVADSFGNMYPQDIATAARQIHEHSSKPWGVHLHNNLELAFSNAIEAMRHGATWIDTSVMGMGRGPGNLKTELFMQHLQARHGRHYDTTPIYEFIGRHLNALYEKHRWGPGPAYVLSGFLGAHPSYAQRLLATDRYSVSEVTRVLRALHGTGKAARFDAAVLAEAISARHQVSGGGASAATRPRLDAESAVPWSKRPVLVIGRGPSAAAQIEAINEYIRANDPIVIECNHSRRVRTATHHFCAFVVSDNARAMAADAIAAGKRPVVASASFLGASQADRAFEEPYDVRENALDVTRDEKMVLPADVVSMLAIAVAARCGCRNVEVVGFDGYAGSFNERDVRMQEEMKMFLALLSEKVPDLRLTSLTPTSYGLLEASIYGRLRDA